MLTLGYIALSPVVGPKDVAECTFHGTGVAPTAANFPVTVEDATNGNGDPITATVGVTVTLIP